MVNKNLNNFKRKKDFLFKENEMSLIAFSTNDRGRSFDKVTKEGRKSLESIKEEFNVDEVIFLNQIHSDKIVIYNGEENFKNIDGDSIITNKKNIAIGVFTADCIPIILVNEKKSVISAIHSGWKGTFNSITKKTLEIMKEKFDVDNKYTKAFIGPHIMDCCYEVSEELKEKFENEKVNVSNLFNNRNLNMQNCVIEDLISAGVKKENIDLLNKCTYCTEDIKLHSYRKSNGSTGRMFTFVILR